MPRRTAAALVCVAFLGGLVAARPAVAAKGESGRCRSGRFLGERLFPDADGRMLIVLANGRLAIGDRCRASRVKMAKTRGGMRIVARWKSCDDGSRNVRVKALLARDCGRLTGRLRLGKVARPLDALGSRCGDAWVDTGKGEFCDSTSDCTSDCRRIGSTACRGPFDSTWHGIQDTIFQARGCTSSLCHGGASQGGLDLRPDAAYPALVNVASPLGGMPRVLPGDEQQSFLWRKLAAATRGLAGVPGTPMPSGLPPIPDDELEGLRVWIRAGAPETGTVPEADTLLASCPPQGGPPPEDPPEPPAPDQAVQLFAPGWTIPPHGESEVCFATYYDFSSQIPAGFQADCPAFWGAGKKCFYYNKTELTQDPNSHHSIIHAYKGAYDITDPSFGPFTCRGGATDGTACDPKGLGVPAPDGADCGPDSGCGGRVKRGVNCIGYGPPDYGVDTGGGTDNSPQIGGAQQPHIVNRLASGVYSMLPVKGILVWNSHAFNTTDQAEMNRQWFTLFFAGESDRQYPAQAIFDLDQIFVQNVPAFTDREYCNTLTLPQGSRVFYLSSHTHKRGKLFRAWTPPNTPCSPGPGCLPEPATRSPALVTVQYSDPAQVYFTPPIALDGADVSSRTIKYCALYDNGLTDPSAVKRRSTSPPPPVFFAPGGPCQVAETTCLGGPSEGVACNGNDSVCGVGGVCDACPLRGGVTTEDEMFILLGSYYTVP
jgi:hypothetical protein